MTTQPHSDLGTDLDTLASEAVASLRKFLTQAATTGLDIGKARVAASALSAWSRYKSTESARETNAIVLARELAENREEFRQLVRVAMPHAALVRALPPARQ